MTVEPFFLRISHSDRDTELTTFVTQIQKIPGIAKKLMFALAEN